MPLQQRGLIRSYNTSRLRYGLAHLLPPKLEQLRRAAGPSKLRHVAWRAWLWIVPSRVGRGDLTGGESTRLDPQERS